MMNGWMCNIDNLVTTSNWKSNPKNATRKSPPQKKNIGSVFIVLGARGMGAYNVKLTTPLTVRSWFSSTCKGKKPTIDRKIQSENTDHDVIKIDVKTMERRVSGQGEHCSFRHVRAATFAAGSGWSVGSGGLSFAHGGSDVWVCRVWRGMACGVVWCGGTASVVSLAAFQAMAWVVIYLHLYVPVALVRVIRMCNRTSA